VLREVDGFATHALERLENEEYSDNGDHQKLGSSRQRTTLQRISPLSQLRSTKFPSAYEHEIQILRFTNTRFVLTTSSGYHHPSHHPSQPTEHSSKHLPNNTPSITSSSLLLPYISSQDVHPSFLLPQPQPPLPQPLSHKHLPLRLRQQITRILPLATFSQAITNTWHGRTEPGSFEDARSMPYRLGS